MFLEVKNLVLTIFQRENNIFNDFFIYMKTVNLSIYVANIWTML